MSPAPWPTILLTMPKNLAQETREKFEQALALLSQSKTGRALLEEAKKDGYILSPVRPEEEKNFRGQASPSPRRIRLSTALEPEIAALTLAHECAHVIQFRAKLGGDPHCRFPDATRLVLASEADALAHMGQVAAELKNETVTAGFAKDFPMAATIIDYLQKMEPQAQDNGKLMAEVFKTFYQTPGIRMQYESGQIKNCEAAVDRADGMGLIGSMAKTLLFVRKIPAQTLLNKFLPYVKEHAPDVDLNAALYCGVSSLTRSRMVALLGRLGRKKEMEAAQNEIPALDQMPSAPESLRLWQEKQNKKNGPL